MSTDSSKWTVIADTFTAKVNAVDVAARTATVSGYAKPGAVVLLNDRIEVQADAKTGAWSATVDNLTLGKNTITAEQYVDEELTQTISIDAELKVEPLTADIAWNADDAKKKAVVSGTAEKGANIVAKNGAGKVIGSATATDGTFSFGVDAPNMGGETVVMVYQSLDGEAIDQKQLTLTYGKAVAISTPENDAEHAGGELRIAGTGEARADVKIREKGSSTFLDGKPSAVNGAWSFTPTLDAREHVLEVIQTGKGNNVTTAEVTINPGAGESDPADPTASVTFDADVAKKATVSGTGVDGATITLLEGSKKIGTATVIDGAWSTTIDALGAGTHTILVEQTGVDGTQTATTDADFGAAVSLTGPTTFAGGKMTVTGKSSQGAKVTIVTGGKQVDSFTVTNADGTFSRDLKEVGSGKIELTATAKSKGALTTTAKHTSTAPITAESVQIASHVRNGTFDPGLQHFVGRGTVGATVTLNPFGFADQYASANITTTVDQFGEWKIDRNLSNTPYTLFAVKQTAQAGVTNELTNYNLRPYDGVGAPGDLSLTNFKAGDFFNPGDQVFAGKATPGAKVILNPFGFYNPEWAGYAVETTADPKTGAWEIRRGLANTVYRELAVRQVPEAEGQVNKIEHITVAANGWVSNVPADLTVTSHADGTFTPGQQTFTGTATPGTKVTVYVWGNNPVNPESAIADATGKWTINRTLGNQPYPVKIVQENAGDKVASVDLPLTPKA